MWTIRNWIAANVTVSQRLNSPLIGLFNQFEPVDGSMLEPLGVKVLDVSLDEVDFFKGEDARFVKTDKAIGIPFDPDIFGFVLNNQEFHVADPF